MRFKPRRLTSVVRADDEDINLISMLDVIFNLLFFFMMGATFRMQQDGIQIKVPEVSDPSTTTTIPQLPIVAVGKDGTMSLDGKIVTAEQLKAELTAQREKGKFTQVVLDADADATVQMAMRAAEAIRGSGVQQILQHVNHSGPAPTLAPVP